MTKVLVAHGPEGAVISNPIMKGAVPDYKATAHNLAAQVLSERVNAINAHQTAKVAVNMQRESHARAMRLAANHWSYFLLSRPVRDHIRSMVDNDQ